MKFEEPTLVLKYGSGAEATVESRAKLQEMRLSQSGIPGWEQACLAYPALKAADVAFVSGSLTQGWGHANSDLDLFVVSDDALEIADDSVEFFEERVACDPSQVWLAIGEIGQFRADIELWRTTQVEQLLGRFESETPNQEGAELGRTEKELLYRLSVGLPLTGAEQWADWKRRIHASSFGLWLAENRKLSAEGMLEDAEGMLVSHDPESAVLAAREGYVLAVEAALAATGDALADAIKTVLIDRDLADRLRQAGAAKVEQVASESDCEMAAELLRRHYDDLLDRREGLVTRPSRDVGTEL